MSHVRAVARSDPAIPAPTRLASLGEWLRRNARLISAMQWSIVALYAFFVAVPAFLPLPADDAHWYNSLAVAAQWMFWGIWWPFVILSMFALGRTWCGLFCPEGTLTEAASRHGLGRAVPRWLKWAGWPFVAFALTTIFGQLVSVYQYPAATLLVLGGSTLAAIGIGFAYGRGKRVWCRHLCPVNGVFAALSRVAPIHFRVDVAAWTANASRIPAHPVNCAPLVRIRRMSGPSDCHMCGRCNGLHAAIALSARAPNDEVAGIDRRAAQRWDAVLIVFGMIGLALGAFEWSALKAFVSLRSFAVERVVETGPAWLLRDDAPWWILTNYPDAHDVFLWLDGVLIVGWIVGTALIVGGWVGVWLVLAARAIPHGRLNAAALAYALIPLAGAGLFVGLSSLTASLAHAEGWRLAWLPLARSALLMLGAAWSFRLASLQLRAAPPSDGAEFGRRTVFFGCIAMAEAGVLAAWLPYLFRVQ